MLPRSVKIMQNFILMQTFGKWIEYEGVEFWGAFFRIKVTFFSKKCPFWPISNTALNF